MLSHASYISSGQLIIDRLVGHIEPCGGPHVGPQVGQSWLENLLVIISKQKLLSTFFVCWKSWFTIVFVADNNFF